MDNLIPIEPDIAFAELQAIICNAKREIRRWEALTESEQRSRRPDPEFDRKTR